MFTITKRFDFSAGHHLEGLPQGHKCGTPHGHNYQVFLELKDEKLDEVGFVQDYNELDVFKKWVDENVDHTYLNEMLPFNPSAENLAMFFYTKAHNLGLDKVTACRVMETDKTTAEYRP